MGKWKENWKQLRPYEKLFQIIGTVLALTTVALSILAILQTMEVTDLSDYLLPVMLLFSSGTMLCQGIYTWRRDRGTAIVSFCSSGFVLLCVLVTTFTYWSRL